MDAAVKFVEEQPKVAVGIIFGLLILLLGNIILSLNNKPAPAKKPRVNHTIKLSDEKVVDKVPCGEIENIAQFKDGKLVMCRCWKSKVFFLLCQFSISLLSKIIDMIFFCRRFPIVMAHIMNM